MRLSLLALALVVVVIVVVAALAVTGPSSSGSGEWVLLERSEREVGRGATLVSVSLEVYKINVDNESLAEAMMDVMEYCMAKPEACGVEPGELEEYIRDGRLAVLAVVAKISNKGELPASLGGPGPICGYSYNLEHLKDPASELLKPHREPISYLDFQVLEGKVVLGYGGTCQEALILHELPPGRTSETVYGFIVVTPFKGTFTIDPFVETEGNWERVTVDVTVNVP